MRWTRVLVVSCCWTAVSAWAGPASAAPTHAIDPQAPWARAIDDEMSKSLFEQIYGFSRDELPRLEGFWQGNLYFDETSYGRSFLDAHGLPDPIPAMGYDATPGILYVAMEGITLSPPPCGGGDEAHSAKKCSPLVQQETAFPPYGDGTQRANLMQTLGNYYEPYNIVLTSSEPPDWVPYTLAVIGGTAANAGQGGGTCGIANVKCDGLRRNHVSLSFPQSCPSIAAIAAQETAHNWGLEHTDITSDIMYPFNNGGIKTFRDECMDIDHSTSAEPITQCDYVHAFYCNGNGETQNSHQELLGVFGPRVTDNTPPEIVSVTPSSGSFTSADTITISAKVAENTNFLGAKWTWEEGLPEGTDSYTRCTNSVCDQDFNTGVDFDPNEVDWDFVTLEQPPAGTYRFKFEVADAYGGYDTITLTLEVAEAGGTSSSDTGGSAGTSDTDGGSDAGSDAGSDSGSSAGSGSDSDSDSDSGADTDGDTDTAGEVDGGKDGCGCGVGSPAPLAAAWLLLPAFVRRRRRVVPRQAG